MSATLQKPVRPSAATPPPPLPPWAIHDFIFQSLPDEHQKAIAEILNPLYEQFVQLPQDHLERSAGASLIFLLWNELLIQCRMGTPERDYNAISEVHRSTYMENILRIVNAKCKLSSVLIRLRQTKPLAPDTQWIPERRHSTSSA